MQCPCCKNEMRCVGLEFVAGGAVQRYACPNKNCPSYGGKPSETAENKGVKNNETGKSEG